MSSIIQRDKRSEDPFFRRTFGEYLVEEQKATKQKNVFRTPLFATISRNRITYNEVGRSLCVSHR